MIEVHPREAQVLQPLPLEERILALLPILEVQKVQMGDCSGLERGRCWLVAFSQQPEMGAGVVEEGGLVVAQWSVEAEAVEVRTVAGRAMTVVVLDWPFVTSAAVARRHLRLWGHPARQ